MELPRLTCSFQCESWRKPRINLRAGGDSRGFDRFCLAVMGCTAEKPRGEQAVTLVLQKIKVGAPPASLKLVRVDVHDEALIPTVGLGFHAL